MCGLVGLIEPTFFSRDLQIFEQLLYADALRGHHSTGVAAMHRHMTEKDVSFEMFKQVGTAVHMLGSKKYDQWADNTIKLNTKVVMGHNRFATRGSINNMSAHPFVSGNIVLCHNGSLNSYTNLPNHQYFDVDSEAIAYSMSDIGVEETIARLNGAFALTWFDLDKKTFNICRNNLRPLSLRTNPSCSRGIWASEDDMLKWILSRNKSESMYNTTWEIAAGDWLEFDITSTSPADFQTYQLELYKPKTVSYSNNRSGNYGNNYHGPKSNNIQSNVPALQSPDKSGDQTKEEEKSTKRELQKASTLEEYNIDRHTSIEFNAYLFTPYYPTDPKSRGVIEGNMYEPPYLGVEVHNVEFDDFIEFGDYRTNAECVSTYNGYDVLIGRGLDLVSINDSTDITDDGGQDEAESAPPFEPDDAKEYIGPTGRRMTKKEMDSICYHGCCVCDDVILESEYSEVSWTNSGFPICRDCQITFEGQMVIGGQIH